jgi:hypothetical protein
MFENTIALFSDDNSIYNVYQRFLVFAIIYSVMAVIFVLIPKYYTIQFVLLLVFGVWIADTFVTLKKKNVTNFNEETLLKLQTIQSKMDEYIDYVISKRNLKITDSGRQRWKDDYLLDYLFTSVDLIHFIYDILPFYDYNPDAFFKFTKGTNNILKLKRQSDDYYKANGKYLEGIADFVNVSLEIKTNCMNILHDFVYTMPKIPEMFEYHNVIISKYDTIMTKIINDFHGSYKDSIKDVNKNTKFLRYRPDLKLPKSSQNAGGFIV